MRLGIAFADELEKGQVVRIGLVRCSAQPTPKRLSAGGSRPSGASPASQQPWLRAKASAKHSEVRLATLHVAAADFGLCGCVGARIGRAVSSREGIMECSHTFLWWWRTDRPE